MTKLTDAINTVLSSLKQKLTPSTYQSRRSLFNRMEKCAKSLGITEPCSALYNAFVADDHGLPERKELHIRCVKLIDAAAKTKAKNAEGFFYNEEPLPSKDEVQAYFFDYTFPVDRNIPLDYLIVKAELEMEHLNLSTSTIGQYRNIWQNIRRYFNKNDACNFDKACLDAYFKDVCQSFNAGQMETWKWKINRKAVSVLLEVAESGQFKWHHISNNLDLEDEALNKVRQDYLASLAQRNLCQTTCELYDYVLRHALIFAGISTVSAIATLDEHKVHDVIKEFSKICNKRSMTTIAPIFRSQLTFLHEQGLANRDLSGVIMPAFNQRRSAATYLNDIDQAMLISSLDRVSKRDKAIIMLAFHLGLRESDICNLRFQQIDWHHDRISLNQQKTGEPLILPLLPDVGNALMDYILNERPAFNGLQQYVFLRQHAPYTHLTSLYSVSRKLFDRLAIEPVNGSSRGMHTLRYTLTHRLLQAQTPHQVITNILGHKSKDSDKPYLSMERDMLKKCALDLSVIGTVSWKQGEVK